MQVVGIDSYDYEVPFGPLLQDALALPIFDGGNMGVRRRQLHAMFMQPEYDPLAACGAASSVADGQRPAFSAGRTTELP